MKYVPNALSLSRIPLAGILLWAVLMDRWVLATVLLMVAMVTDALDGMVARRYNAESKFGGEILESACDMALAVAAVAGLVITGVWSAWIAWFLLGAATALQVAHSTPLRRHSYYIHPMFAVAVIFVVGGTYLWVASHATGLVLLYIAALVAVSVKHFDRVEHWLAGPPPAKD